MAADGGVGAGGVQWKAAGSCGGGDGSFGSFGGGGSDGMSWSKSG